MILFEKIVDRDLALVLNIRRGARQRPLVKLDLDDAAGRFLVAVPGQSWLQIPSRTGLNLLS
jgi:hypothetical protein